MKKTKTILSVLLTTVMLLTMFTAVPFSVSAADGVYHVTNSEDFWNAQNDINSYNSGTYDVYIDKSFESTYGFSVKKPVTVNFYGEGNTLTFTAREQYIAVTDGATVNLGSPTYKKTFTISGKTNVLYNDCAGAVHVWGTSSTCNMYDGVTIKDRKGNNYLGGGVTVESGTFNMYGGTIDKCGIDGGSVCYGGGVAVYNGGTFVMNGGVIKDCYVTNTYSSSWQTPRCAGGGVFVWRSTFVMNGGEICNCSASSNDAIGGGIAVVTSDEAYFENGNGYGYLDSIFTMNSGKVDKCTASVVGGGLAVGMGYLNLIFCCTDSTILSGPANPGMIINGGEMSDNGASQGGAVFLNWIRGSRPVQIKNTTFKNNEAATGGAISVSSYWTQAQIEGCTFTGNTAESNGAAISLLKNSSGSGTHIKDTTITGNTITDTDNDLSNRGAGVYYDANSKLTISGANIIQDNTYNGKKNNLNIYSKDKPVYIDGELTYSQIGLSDPSLWDDGKEDNDSSAVSEDYLTSGYNTYNAGVNPINYFSSDHETWYADYSDSESAVSTNEVRLVRKVYDVNYHINNDDKSSIYADDYFTPYITNHEIKHGKTIEEFHNIPKLKDPDGYVFKGWYYDKDNDNDSNPIKFGQEYGDKEFYQRGIDIYAHWEKVGEVQKDAKDDKILPDSMNNKYSNYGLFGVQIRPEQWLDENIGSRQPGGLRFVTSISEDLLKNIDALSDKKVESQDGNKNKVEYGYVAASEDNINTVISKFNEHKPGLIWANEYKLQYKGTDVNGVDTTVKGYSADNFNYVTNIDCTSQQGNYGSNPDIKIDHRNFENYRLSTFVVKYDDDNTGENKAKNVVARAYIRYYDANGLLRTFYNDYGGTCVYGGCSTSYKAINPFDYELDYEQKEIANKTVK
ncbi:MAG: hypothetical protein VZQ55_04735 [Ruminococcus sp.]|nr:hypothetical protein [Ruminococcus sp.]